MTEDYEVKMDTARKLVTIEEVEFHKELIEFLERKSLQGSKLKAPENILFFADVESLLNDAYDAILAYLRPGDGCYTHT